MHVTPPYLHLFSMEIVLWYLAAFSFSWPQNTTISLKEFLNVIIRGKDFSSNLLGPLYCIFVNMAWTLKLTRGIMLTFKSGIELSKKNIWKTFSEIMRIEGLINIPEKKAKKIYQNCNSHFHNYQRATTLVKQLCKLQICDRSNSEY